MARVSDLSGNVSGSYHQIDRQMRWMKLIDCLLLLFWIMFSIYNADTASFRQNHVQEANRRKRQFVQRIAEKEEEPILGGSGWQGDNGSNESLQKTFRSRQEANDKLWRRSEQEDGKSPS